MTSIFSALTKFYFVENNTFVFAYKNSSVCADISVCGDFLMVVVWQLSILFWIVPNFLD